MLGTSSACRLGAGAPYDTHTSLIKDARALGRVSNVSPLADKHAHESRALPQQRSTASLPPIMAKSLAAAPNNNVFAVGALASETVSLTNVDDLEDA